MKALLFLFALFLANYAFAQPKAFNNPNITAINLLAPRANFTPYKDGKSALLNATSQRQLSINGNWDFLMVEGKENIPQDFYQPDYNAKFWNQLTVPSNWQRKGYGFPMFSNATLDLEPDEVGLYRRYFTVPENWKKNRTIIHFAGVKTAFHIYVNGKQVGYNEPAYLPSEFDITDYLQDGKNLISVAVYRVADIQKIENFDTWRLSGIFRDVYLLNRPSAFIDDVEVLSPAVNHYKDGEWTVKTKITNKGKKATQQLTLKVELRKKADQSLIAEKAIAVPSIKNGESKTIEVAEIIPNVDTWNAETPNLYTTVVELVRDENPLEGLAINTGFRTIEVLDEQIKVNGQKIYFKGVNRHDWHQDMGRAINREVIIKGLKMMKACNINAIRTSHYPNDAFLYSLADELGFYILDEAAMETHWVTHAEKDPGFRQPHVSRIQRLIERDKNHPSVIMWSLGNEFHMGPHTNAMYEYAVKRDPSRLIYCDGDPKREDLAVRPSAYKDMKGLKASAAKGKPVVMKEYMHAAGNEMGLFAQLWDVIRNPQYKQLQGGFIWDWKDQAWIIHKKNQNPYYDWGEDAGVSPTGNDGFDGITNADMELTPKLLEVASVFQDIKVRAENIKKGQFSVLNRHSFKSLDGFNARWTLKVNGNPMLQNQLSPLSTAAGKSQSISIHPNQLSRYYSENDDVQLLFEFFDNASGQKAAWDQICLQEGTYHIGEKTDAKVSVLTGDRSYTIKSGKSVYKFNCQLGRFTSWKNNGDEMLYHTQGPRLNLWRATTDADNSDWGSLQAKYHRAWKLVGLDDPEFFEHKVKTATLTENSDKKAVIDVRIELTVAKEVMGVAEFRYTFLPNGKLILGVNLLPGEKMSKLAGLPRLGITTQFNDSYTNIKWYGMGPHENYRDRIESASVDNYQSTPAEMYTSYVPAQANGNRCGVRWMSMDNGKNGLRIMRVSENNAGKNFDTYLPFNHKYKQAPTGSFEFTAIPFTEYELETVTHHKDLPKSERVVLTIDSEHAGVASHPRPSREPEHEVSAEKKSFAFIFEEME